VKTAISIPNGIYQAAEQLAACLGISRSELYARAVDVFVKRHENENLTARINQVCESVDTSLDPALRSVERALLRRDEWK
jgi:metal-responsive CopG/Arc/MetJ family transcriptional regulator